MALLRPTSRCNNGITRGQKVLNRIVGAIGAIAVLLSSVLGLFGSKALFRNAQRTYGYYAVFGMSEADIDRFSDDTITYFRDESKEWTPQLPFAVPEAFQSHMANVKVCVVFLKYLAIALAALYALLMIGLCLKEHFSRSACFQGFLTFLAVCACLVLWCAVDFDSFWSVLHHLFITDGIFSANEPIMLLFPLSLFESYYPYLILSILLYGILFIGWMLICRSFCLIALQKRHNGERKHG